MTTEDDLPTPEEALSALHDVARALVEHLSQEAHRVNCCVEMLCPCYENEVKRARDVLRRFNYGHISF